MREIQLNMYHALALGAVMYWLGAVLTRKLPALRRFCVPAPLVGGLCFALFNTLLYASGLAVITFDETLETVFMILFFTTVGFTVSIPMLVKSGRSVMLLLALSIVIILLQNAVGSGVMALMGKNPLYGLGCGSTGNAFRTFFATANIAYGSSAKKDCLPIPSKTENYTTTRYLH